MSKKSEQTYRLTWMEHDSEDGMNCENEGEVIDLTLVLLKGTGERYRPSSTQYWVANTDIGAFEWLGYKSEFLRKLKKWLKEMKKQDSIEISDITLHD